MAETIVTKTVVNELFNRCVDGLYGLQDVSDYEYFVNEKKVFSEEEYFKVARMFRDGVITDTERLEIADIFSDKYGDTESFTEEFSKAFGSDGANALRERFKWLRNWSETGWSRTDYSENAREEMKEELARLEAVQKLTAGTRLNAAQLGGVADELLDNMNGESVESFLEGLLLDGDTVDRENTARVLAFMDSPCRTNFVNTEMYVKALKDNNLVVQISAAQIIANHKCMVESDMAAETLPELRRMLLFRDSSSAAAKAIFAICLKHKDPEMVRAVPHLIGMLYNDPYKFKDGDVRAQEDAAYALGAIGPVAIDATASLVGILELRGYARRKNAAIWAIGEIFENSSGSENLTLALKALKDELAASIEEENDEKINWIAIALGKIGPAAKDAVPLLIKALNMYKRYVVEKRIDWVQDTMWQIDIALHNISGN